ncbi:hypothetical protein NHJ13051_005235 [Beauveria bassiana]
MPNRLDTHVLTVDANVIHKVDTANPANLYSMWTVFSRCADSLEQGRRLENLSWRLWQREQLVDNEERLDASAANTNTNTSPLATTWRPQDLPQLSGSVDSLVDEDATEFVSESTPLEIRPRIRRLDSTSSRGRRDRHISSDDFKQMVVSIVNDTAPLSAPTATSPLTASKKETAPIAPALAPAELTTVAEMATEPEPTAERHAIVAPEVPVCESFPQPSHIEAAIPEPEAAPAHQPVAQKKAPAKFALGGSCSSSEQGMSVEMTKSSLMPPKAMFQIGGSSESTSTKSSSTKSDIQPVKAVVPQKKQVVLPTTRNAQLEAESAIDSDTDDDYVDESAIDDDDDGSDWEDSMEDSGKSSVDEKFFQRVESKANLVSRPSLITLMLAQSERQKNLSNQASHSASAIIRSRAGPSSSTLGVSPNDSDEGPLMMKGMRPSNLRPIIEAPRSSAQPIVAPTNHVHAQAALSPRTTRRNMLATELTESLRRHLLWERQQKTSTANAVLKRRHTSHDVANLKQFPEKPCMKKSEDANASSWNQYFNKDTFDGYHSKGW